MVVLQPVSCSLVFLFRYIYFVGCPETYGSSFTIEHVKIWSDDQARQLSTSKKCDKNGMVFYFCLKSVTYYEHLDKILT